MRKTKKTDSENGKVSYGFTLIELSIVLVIIALMVGGIIGGKALVKSARMQSVVSEVSTVKTAFSAFLLQYDTEPGDMIDARDYWPNDSLYPGFSTGNGNGNHQVDLFWNAGGEIGRLWEHMNAAGVYPGLFSGDNGNGPTIGEDAPASAIEPALYQVFYDASGFGNYEGNAHIISIGVTDVNYFNRPHMGSLNGKDAKMLDKKIDDGFARQGAMRSRQGWDNGSRQSPGCTVTLDGEYDPSLEQVACVPYIRVY